MADFAVSILVDFWATVAEMSPYLLFGFFAAGILSVLVSQELVERHLGGSGMWPAKDTRCSEGFKLKTPQ